jgi:hypothetical protein
MSAVRDPAIPVLVRVGSERCAASYSAVTGTYLGGGR